MQLNILILTLAFDPKLKTNTLLTPASGNI